MEQYINNGEVIEATQFNRINFENLWKLTEGKVSELVVKSDKIGDAFCMLNKTDYGDITIQEGDYVIKGIESRFYAMKPDTFLSMYRPVVVLGVDCKE